MFKRKRLLFFAIPILTFTAGFYCAELRRINIQQTTAKAGPPIEMVGTKIYKIQVKDSVTNYDTAVKMKLKCNRVIANPKSVSEMGWWGGKAYLWFEDDKGNLHKDDHEIAGAQYPEDRPKTFGDFTPTYEFSTAHIPKNAQRIMLFCEPEVHVKYKNNVSKKDDYNARFIIVVK